MAHPNKHRADTSLKTGDLLCFPVHRLPPSAPRPPYSVVPPGCNMVLRRAIRGCDHAADIVLALRRFPLLHETLQRFAYYLTDVIPASAERRRSLISRCVNNAIANWHRAEAQCVTERQCFKKFLQGLYADVPQTLQWRIFIERGEKELVWNPGDGPITDWWSRHQLAPIVRPRRVDGRVDHLRARDLRMIVAVHTLNELAISVLDNGLDSVVS